MGNSKAYLIGIKEAALQINGERVDYLPQSWKLAQFLNTKKIITGPLHVQGGLQANQGSQREY